VEAEIVMTVPLLEGVAVLFSRSDATDQRILLFSEVCLIIPAIENSESKRTNSGIYFRM
jgi:hypothetical protein